MMDGVRSKKRWILIGVVVLLAVLAGALGLGACASGDGMEPVSTTAAGAYAGEAADSRMDYPASEEMAATAAPAADGVEGGGADGSVTGQLTTLQQASGQKIISNAQVELKVESGHFQDAFAKALLIADRYGGYIVSSNSHASGGEGSLNSGTIAIRVPSSSFDNALADASTLGEVQNRQVQTEDVTEEYVDLQARITNSKAHVQAVTALLAKAKTVDEILQVQQVLSMAQQELEQLEGRKRFLDEHTSYSTVTMSIYEAGVVLTASTEWGVVEALKDGLRNVVSAFNAIIRGLGVLVPVLVVLAIIGYAAYRIWRSAVRRRQKPEAPQQEG